MCVGYTDRFDGDGYEGPRNWHRPRDVGRLDLGVKKCVSSISRLLGSLVIKLAEVVGSSILLLRPPRAVHVRHSSFVK
jgi:hypothetical protein